jgi:hypothetical protein
MVWVVRGRDEFKLGLVEANNRLSEGRHGLLLVS